MIGPDEGRLAVHVVALGREGIEPGLVLVAVELHRFLLPSPANLVWIRSPWRPIPHQVRKGRRYGDPGQICYSRVLWDTSVSM